MQLQAALKTSLDELRMQMLGAQVLFGFQFQGLFQDNFAAVPASARTVDAVALLLMILVLGLIVAVPSQHRIVDGGEISLRTFNTSLRYSKIALAPLAGAIACDLYVAACASFGARVSAILASAAFGLSIIAWYLLGLLIRRVRAEPGDYRMQKSVTTLHEKLEQMLTEARVILPGAQALLGFQFIVMMTQSFAKLPGTVQLVHLVGLLSLVLAIILVIAPAALHRIAFDGRDDPQLHRFGSLMITLALLPLAAAISCDIWVATFKLYGPGWPPSAAATVAASLLLWAWYAWPLLKRRRLHR
jgi:hypothetical protein